MNKILAVMIVLLLTACGANTNDSSPVLPSPTPLPETVAPLSHEEASELYLKSTAIRNSSAKDLSGELVLTEPNVEKIRHMAEEARNGSRSFLEALDGNVWPEDIQESVDALKDCVAKEISYFDSLTRLKSSVDLWYPELCGGPEAQLIRMRLGLSSDTD